MSVKSLSMKQAEKWLESLKRENTQTYKELVKVLKKFESTEDEYETYKKMSRILLDHPSLTRQINPYLQEGNKFLVKKSQNQKFKELIELLKTTQPHIWKRVTQLFSKVNTDDKKSKESINKNLKKFIKEQVKGDPQLQEITENAFDASDEILLNKQDLSHLRTGVKKQKYEEEMSEVSAIKPEPIVQKKHYEFKKEPKIGLSFSPIPTYIQERAVFKFVEKTLEPQIFQETMKIIKLYYLNILSRAEITDLLSGISLQKQLQYLIDIIQARQTDRRKHSIFQPLNYNDFGNSFRASPSYIPMPLSYPKICSSKTAELKQLLNDKWVSVPYGSQQEFNIRNKNISEISLMRSEDERYEFDLWMKRLKLTEDILTTLIQQLQSSAENQQKIDRLLNKVLKIGAVQMIYKNSSKDQKEEIEWHLKVNTEDTCQILKMRVHNLILELNRIKEIYALKSWEDIAEKHSTKALDLKGFEFKKNEKERMKDKAFIQELVDRSKKLEEGSINKAQITCFDEERNFFEILNSFQSSSRTQRCNSRKLPEIQSFDLNDENKRQFYPLTILAFEDRKICDKLYSFLIFYIDSSMMSQTEKVRCKLFLELFLVTYLGWNSPRKRFLNENFKGQDLLFAIINEVPDAPTDYASWITEVKEQKLCSIKSDPDDPKGLPTTNQADRNYAYYPISFNSQSVCFGSQLAYSFVRFLYTIYERLIKMEEVVENPAKILQFQLLFQNCVKTKQGSKFEESLTAIFGKSAYMFSAIYRLFDLILKNLAAVSNCTLTHQSMKYYLNYYQNQALYTILLNKLCLIGNYENTKLIRFNRHPTSGVLYINLMSCYYKNEDAKEKDLIRKAFDIIRGIDIYTWDRSQDHYGCAAEENYGHKKRKLNTEMYTKNSTQYIFESSSFKMHNHREKEDLLFYHGASQTEQKRLSLELKRVNQLGQSLK